MRMVIIGIDPGKDGAVCEMNEKAEIISINDMPVGYRTQIDEKKRLTSAQRAAIRVIKQKTKKELDCKQLNEMIKKDCHVSLEKVGAMAGQGVTSMFSFGQIYGAIKAISEINATTVEHVTPQAWQKHFGLIMTKERKQGLTKGEITKIHKLDIYKKVIELYPDMDENLKGARGGLKDGRCDAILIARYLVETKFQD